MFEFASRLLLIMNSSCSFPQISKLLVIHPKIRLTAEQALEHPWFQGAQVCTFSFQGKLKVIP